MEIIKAKTNLVKSNVLQFVRIKENKSKNSELTWEMPVMIIYVAVKSYQDRHFDICRYACIILCKGMIRTD
jgi:hypothetical protein